MQERRLAQEIANIEKDTGFKLRLLAQNYPETPGMLYIAFFLENDCSLLTVLFTSFSSIFVVLVEIFFMHIITGSLAGLAIKDYWQVDDRTIVFVADPTFGKLCRWVFHLIVDSLC